MLSKGNFSLFITLKINILWIFFKTEGSKVRFNKEVVILNSISHQYTLLWKMKLTKF